MAYSFVTSSSQYMNTSSVGTFSEPFTLACWFNITAGTTAQSSLVSINSSSTVQRHSLNAQGTAGTTYQVRAVSFDSSGASADSTTSYTNGTWNHAAGVFSSSTSRTAYLNGGGKATNTTSRLITVNYFGIGMLKNVSPQNYTNGAIAEVGVWSAALTDDEIYSLSRGISCNLIRPQSLYFHVPLIRGVFDLRKGLTITSYNTPTVSSHPRIYLP